MGGGEEKPKPIKEGMIMWAGRFEGVYMDLMCLTRGMNSRKLPV